MRYSRLKERVTFPEKNERLKEVAAGVFAPLSNPPEAVQMETHATKKHVKTVEEAHVIMRWKTCTGAETTVKNSNKRV